MKLHNAIIGSAPKSGKTTMLLHLASTVLSQGYTALYIGTDTSYQGLRNISEKQNLNLEKLNVIFLYDLAETVALGRDLRFDYVFLDDAESYDERAVQELITKCETRGAKCIITYQLPESHRYENLESQWEFLCRKYPLNGFDKFILGRTSKSLYLHERKIIIEKLELLDKINN